MGTQMIWLIIIGSGLVCGFIACFVASEKGYSGITAFFWGFLFNFVGVLYAAGLPESIDKKVEHALIIDQAVAKQRVEAEKRAEAEREYDRRERERQEYAKAKMERVKAEQEHSGIQADASGFKGKNGGKAVKPIEISPDAISCPLCGLEQRTPRIVCFGCGAKFMA